MVRLLEEGKLPFHIVGSHRRVYLKDLLAYKKRRDEERHDAIVRMARWKWKRAPMIRSYSRKPPSLYQPLWPEEIIIEMTPTPLGVAPLLFRVPRETPGKKEIKSCIRIALL